MHPQILDYGFDALLLLIQLYLDSFEKRLIFGRIVLLELDLLEVILRLHSEGEQLPHIFKFHNA